jgi:hypothetical protein
VHEVAAAVEENFPSGQYVQIRPELYIPAREEIRGGQSIRYAEIDRSGAARGGAGERADDCSWEFTWRTRSVTLAALAFGEAVLRV